MDTPIWKNRKKTELIGEQQVVDFIGTEAYAEYKKKRFPTEVFDIPVSQNEAFLLQYPAMRESFRQPYEVTKALYYQGQPPFNGLMERKAGQPPEFRLS